MNEMNKNSKKHWGSLEEYFETSSFKDGIGREFLAPPQEQKVTEIERRDFLKVMGAGLFMATAACTRRPVEKIIPYVNRPLDTTPGVANYYTSTCDSCSSGCGILVKTREGRPIKVEGNPEHVMNEGALCARGQASVLNLYDPDRLKAPLVIEDITGLSQELTLAELDDSLKNKFNALRQGNKKLVLLTGLITSPTTLKIIRDFLSAYPGSQHVMFDAAHPEEVSLANDASYGEKMIPHYAFDKADAVVSFGADFLGTYVSPVEFSKKFSKNRKLAEKPEMSQLTVVESVLSLTGTNADVHHAVKPGDELVVALGVANLVGKKSGGVPSVIAAYNAEKVSGLTGVSAKALEDIADTLLKNRGKSLVLGGTVRGAHAVALQTVVNFINSALGNDGITVDFGRGSNEVSSGFGALTQLVSDMKAGNVGALIIQGINPVFSLPASLKFADALSKVPLTVSFAKVLDETAKISDYVVAESHAFETWGDANPRNGLYSIIQPTISPLYSTRSLGEMLLVLSGNTQTYYTSLKATWNDSILGGTSWDEVLQKGFVQKEGGSASRSFNSSALAVVPANLGTVSNKFILSLCPSRAISDSQDVNNSWLQEMPDPISKVTWDNYISMAPQAARDLRLAEGDVVAISAAGVSGEFPVHIQPKMHPQTLSLAVGYGRKVSGKVGTGVGFDAYPFQQVVDGNLAWGGLVLESVIKTGVNHQLAITQGHHTMEGRDIVRETTLEEFAKNPEASNEGHEAEDLTLWPVHEYKGYRWGMAIDMSVCTGCNACMIGCQSENNIPTVGREQVIVGREMHWIRVDRYYVGDPDKNPDVSYQPMLCQHCENAPCETVCPVIATVHDEEGLNTMVYNRCVGTRYCANNCPYKVRRFNYFGYHDVVEKPRSYQFNPEVTVREQGVMEKCTFCIQRIHEAKWNAKYENRLVKDGEIKTACQQTCPTDAIVFGNTNDPDSKVSKIKKLPRGYHVLEETNVKSQVTYLAKVRNKVSA
ncbi:TAT-variant-translocated molybdopterin oxidoreductase [bacterium]|nr:TAT-variant-translocated molybdopterin oxidoreductase [bacterium]